LQFNFHTKNLVSQDFFPEKDKSLRVATRSKEEAPFARQEASSLGITWDSRALLALESLKWKTINK